LNGIASSTPPLLYTVDDDPLIFRKSVNFPPSAIRKTRIPALGIVISDVRFYYTAALSWILLPRGPHLPHVLASGGMRRALSGTLTDPFAILLAGRQGWWVESRCVQVDTTRT